MYRCDYCDGIVEAKCIQYNSNDTVTLITANPSQWSKRYISRRNGVPYPWFYSNSMLIQKMVLRRTGDEPLSKPRFTHFNDAQIRHEAPMCRCVATIRHEVITSITNANICHTFLWHYMMTSSNGNISRVTGPLCGEFLKRPATRSFDVLWSAPEQMVE